MALTDRRDRWYGLNQKQTENIWAQEGVGTIMKREIKYGDYMALGWNTVPEELQVDFLAYFKFLLDSDFRDLEEYLKTVNFSH